MWAAFIDLFRNHDDLVKDLLLACDVDGLKKLAKRELAETYVDFEGGGGGTYRLRIRTKLS